MLFLMKAMTITVIINLAAMSTALHIPLPQLRQEENSPLCTLFNSLSPTHLLNYFGHWESPTTLVESGTAKEKLNVFITGGTGYIGGEFLHELISNDKHKFNIRALVRSKEKGELLRTATDYRITPVIGDLDSLDLLKAEFETADIIVDAATNNHLPSAQILDDVLSVKESTTILFHISGVSLISTSNQTDKTVWSDIDDNKAINQLPNGRPHIQVDRTIMNIKNKNPEHARPVIISPATIYGTSEGYDNVLSVQVPTLIKKSIELGQAFTVKDGNYDWSNVHIRDLGSMFILLLEQLLEDKNSVKTGNEGFYFVETAAHSWLDVSERIAELLYERQVINTIDVAHLDEETSDKLFGSPLSSLYDTNALTRADLARSYGWVPTHELEFEQSIEVSVSDELDP